MRGVTIFLSAPSARRATLPFGVAVDDQIISIHALREEGDSLSQDCFLTGVISIHALREEGDAANRQTVTHLLAFLSTPSARRATADGTVGFQHDVNFYPRPPRGGRRSTSAASISALDFYPRPPRGGRPLLRCRRYHSSSISIHALREEGDLHVNCLGSCV